MSGEIPTYPYEEEDAPEGKIERLTVRVEELESTNKALRNELSRDMQASGETQLAAVRDAVAATDDLVRSHPTDQAKDIIVLGYSRIRALSAPAASLSATSDAEGPTGHRGAFGWRSDETLMQAYQRVCLELESARELLVLLWRERAALPSGLVEQIRPWTTSSPAPQTFEQAWAVKEAEGYQYGEDALEKVRIGWEMAKGKI